MTEEVRRSAVRCRSPFRRPIRARSARQRAVRFLMRMRTGRNPPTAAAEHSSSPGRGGGWPRYARDTSPSRGGWLKTTPLRHSREGGNPTLYRVGARTIERRMSTSCSLSRFHGLPPKADMKAVKNEVRYRNLSHDTKRLSCCGSRLFRRETPFSYGPALSYWSTGNSGLHQLHERNRAIISNGVF